MSEQIAFIFDMDGVIADNMTYHAQSWIELFKDKGHDVDLNEFNLYAAGRKAEEVLEHYLSHPFSENEATCLSQQKDLLYRYLYRPHLKPLEGLLKFITKARELSIPMGIGTGSSPENIEFVLNGLNIKSFFSSIIGAAQVKNGKPDPEIFLRVSQELDVLPENCIVFEDSQFGIQAARRAAMKVIGLSTSHNHDELNGFGEVIQTAKDFTHIDPQMLISTYKPSYS